VAGVVTAVLAVPGQAVDKGALLVELGPIPSE
jgi:multidrug resistance efflux pump